MLSVVHNEDVDGSVHGEDGLSMVDKPAGAITGRRGAADDVHLLHVHRLGSRVLVLLRPRGDRPVTNQDVVYRRARRRGIDLASPSSWPIRRLS